MSNDTALWVEKYRPRVIDDCILTERVKKQLKGFIKKKHVPNLLFTAGPGCGKTTLARAIVRELGAEQLFIDCSTDNGKQMIHDMIVPFASTISMGNQDVSKFIICDESDGLTVQAQRSLRPIIEQYAATTRFIFTGNYPERFIDALKSRCSQIDLSITKEDKPYLCKEFYKRCENILNENNIEFDMKTLGMFIIKHFPDYRKIINELQSYSSAYNKIDSGILTVASDQIASSIYPILKEKKFDECRKWVAENINSPDDIFSSLYKNLDEYIDKKKQPDVILIIAQYQEYSSHVVNQQINLMACFVEIMSVL